MRSIRRLALLLGGLFLCAGMTGTATAAEAKDYSYLYLQGKISDPLDRHPLAAAEVQLTGPAGRFEAETDAHGVFVFERLPVAEYRLEVTASDGRVLRGVIREDSRDHDRIRLRIDLGRGPAESIGVEGHSGRIGVTIPEQRTKWKRLWAEMGIFAAAALLLAL